MGLEIKRPAKVLMAIVGFGIFYGGYTIAESHGWTKGLAKLFPTPGIEKAIVPQKAELPKLVDSQTAPTVVPVTNHITSTPAKLDSTVIRCGFWEWNAQDNIILANGGAQTTKGSLMETHGVNLLLYRQDDTGVMTQDLVKCATEIHGGAKQCSTGANFVIIMGDGAGQFAAGANHLLKDLGPDYLVKVIGATGYSRGEDSFMAPPNVKQNPENAKGLLIAGVPRDGDWNIALKWAGDNTIKNNPDKTTWDPGALNWVESSDYNVAAADYNSNKCENRKVVEDGVLSSVNCTVDKDGNNTPDPKGSQKCETVHVCVNAVVTWTPGDVTVVHPPGRGGVVKVVSSAQYRSQMPAVIIGPGKFFEDNRKEITAMLAATFEAGDQIRSFDKALHQASDISAAIYNDADEQAKHGEYWYKYFKGVVETDSQGNQMMLKEPKDHKVSS